MEKMMVGIDLGATNLRIGLVDESYRVVKFERSLTRELVCDGDTLRALGECIERFLDGLPAPEAVVIGFPAVVSGDHKMVRQSPNIAGFDNINFADGLSSRLKCPVIIERDCNLLLAGEIYARGMEQESVLGFYIGTGYVNALFLNGRFWEGADGAAGEIGHIPLYGVHERCGCGNEGCVESIGSGARLVRHVKETYPGEDVANVFTAHPDDPFLDAFLEVLAIPIATEVNLLNPAHIIIGGGVAAMQGFPREKLEKNVLHHVRRPVPFETLRFLYADDNPQASVLGAAYYARRYIHSA